MQLVFATHNQNKLIEIKAILPDHIEVLSLNDINCTEEILETASTIEGNALIKANYIAKYYGYNCFADDTGLEVEALNGAPGVYSARFAGEQKNANDNINKLLKELSLHNNRKAHFKTVVALHLKNQEPVSFEGIIKGHITKSKRGSNGFGYDPVFQPIGYDETFAELSLPVKNKISHRARAMKKLLDYLKNKS